jgi:hypothetical protein
MSVGGPRKWVDRGDREPVAFTKASFAKDLAREAESLRRGVASAALGMRRRFPAGLAAIARQEVLERIESGKSSIGGRRPARRT